MRDIYGCGEKPIPVTTTFIDHYRDWRKPTCVIWGTINGVPVYMPWGTRTITIPSEWLQANPPPTNGKP